MENERREKQKEKDQQQKEKDQQFDLYLHGRAAETKNWREEQVEQARKWQKQVAGARASGGSKGKTCRLWGSGTCRYGDKCKFAHRDEEAAGSIHDKGKDKA